jgi:hypothetical protein
VTSPAAPASAGVRLDRIEPEGGALRALVRRLLREPAVLVALVFLACGIALALVPETGARWNVDADADPVALAFLAWAVATAALGRWLARARVDDLPRAADDDPLPIALDRWASTQTTRPEAHVLPGALRITGAQWLGSEIGGAGAAVAVVAVAAVPSGGWGAAAASVTTLLILRTLGCPRRRRVQLDLPWDAIHTAHLEDRRSFRLCGPGDATLATVEASFEQRQRLAEVLAQRLADRFHGVQPSSPQPAPEPGLALLSAYLVLPHEEDEEAGVAAALVHRLRNRPVAALAVTLLALSAALHVVAYAVATTPLRVVGGLCAFVGGLLAFVAASKMGDAWRRPRPAPDDSADPALVRWKPRPGWPGPRRHRVHALPRSFRIVAHEWDPWDAVVVLASTLACAVAGATVIPCFAVWIGAAALMLLHALGIPRRRRIEVDVPWEEIERVELRGWTFEVVSRLPEPAARIRFQPMGTEERATVWRRLHAHLGARVTVVPSAPQG